MQCKHGDEHVGNTSTIDDLHMSIVLNGPIDVLSVLRVMRT
jgi:hypothetical protein